LREIGEDADYCLLDSGKAVEESYVKTITQAQALDSDWWKQSKADCVVMMGGGRKLLPYYRAIKGAGKRLFLRMDTDGIFSPRQFWKKHWRGKVIYYTDRISDKHPRLSLPFGYCLGTLHTVCNRLQNRSFDFSILNGFAFADRLMIESPLALERFQSFAMQRPDLSVFQKARVVHPAVCCGNIGAVDKENLILSVGTWWRNQKNANVLLQALSGALARNSEFHALIAGPASARLSGLLSRFPTDVRQRISLRDNMSRAEVDALYARAKILFLASRGEGFPNVAAEASCYGCSVVGWKDIAAFHFFESIGYGTTAEVCSTSAFVSAICKEIDLWKSGQRNHGAAAGNFRKLFLARNVAESTKHLLQELL
jgi:glycosyltransferase involved in cell wall biosynthesis